MIDYLKDGTITMYAEAARIANAMKLTSAERAVFNIIFSYCRKAKDKECRLAHRYFEDWTGLSHATVVNVLRRLEDMNLIKKEYYLRDDSDVIRAKYLLVEIERNSRAELKAAARIFAQNRIDEAYRRKKERELKAEGLEPLPAELIGNGYKGIKTDSAGVRYLIPDGSMSGRNCPERYYSKEEYNSKFADVHNADDINI